MMKIVMQLALVGALASAVFGMGAVGKPVARPKVQTAKVKITARGYAPTAFKLRKGIPARVTFLRTTDATCVKEIVLPDFNIRRALPLNQPVVVEFTAKQRGAFTFACGMNMMRGELIVQ